VLLAHLILPQHRRLGRWAEPDGKVVALHVNYGLFTTWIISVAQVQAAVK
jgi:hypothetical protein